MARKRYGEDDILRLIREVEVHCNSGMDVVSACRTAGVSDKTYYGLRRKQYGGMGVVAIRKFSYKKHFKAILMSIKTISKYLSVKYVSKMSQIS